MIAVKTNDLVMHFEVKQNLQEKMQSFIKPVISGGSSRRAFAHSAICWSLTQVQQLEVQAGNRFPFI